MRSRTRSILGGVALLAITVSGVGCSSSSSSGPPRSGSNLAPYDGLHVWSEGGYAFTATVDNNDMLGSAISLHRQPSGAQYTQEEGATEGPSFQGTIFDRPVSVSFSGSSARGIFGGAPLNLDVAETPEGGITVRGLVGGALSEFEVSPTRWTGHVGPCGYDLTGSGGRYDGSRNCGRGTRRVRIEIGKPISDWPPIERATLLALALRR
ncbi:hypothetical protein [Pendulispora albinea]|uniref:Uncharacterized protein n=1 Tax=Pendulispora albinea TaxID=2741071 RepID=A0ABZ2M3K7_9BACT